MQTYMNVHVGAERNVVLSVRMYFMWCGSGERDHNYIAVLVTLAINRSDVMKVCGVRVWMLVQ